MQNVWNDPQLRAQMPGVVATINGEQIPYSELAEECLLRYGQEVLDVEISHLLLQAVAGQGQPHGHRPGSQRRNRPTRPSWPASWTKTAQPDMEKWIETATEEQGVTKDQYLRDSVWPSAALKKLVSRPP